MPPSGAQTWRRPGAFWDVPVAAALTALGLLDIFLLLTRKFLAAYLVLHSRVSYGPYLGAGGVGVGRVAGVGSAQYYGARRAGSTPALSPGF